VLVPLFHEGTFAPVLVDQLLTLDYPADRLEVLLLVEAEDDETRGALARCDLPEHVQVVVVAPGTPRTKPRALNAGLAYAGGEFVVVYDAEDRPEPLQLRKAVAAFRSLPRRVVCLQARLNFYNRHQSLLTRLLSVDYVVWYDMMLPGLVSDRAMVPLGGTSNHFRVEALRRLGGWDPYNVTEDADLGVRIARAGLRVRMLDSITWEEAVAQVRPWVRQRSRWIKGYMQTYLVHMRHPIMLFRQIGPRAYLDFQLLLGGTSLLLLVNPIMWALTIAFFAAKGTPFASAIHLLYPTPLYYPALACLLANYLFFYMQLYIVVRRGYDDLARFALLGPLYWVLMSIGAWAGLLSLVFDPYYWAKTEHGVSLTPGGQPVGDEHVSPQAAVALAWSGIETEVECPSDTSDERPTRTFPALLEPLTPLSLSVVLPAYNEEAQIVATVRSIMVTLWSWNLDFEMIVVNDGSRDRTGEILEALALEYSQLRVVTHPVNRGYGATLVRGFAEARNELVFCMDADGQFDITDLAGFLRLIPWYDAVLGYRVARQDSRVRLLNAWGWKQLVRLCLGVRVRDVDCAFKLFRANFLHSHPCESRSAMINAELLYKLRRGGYTSTQVSVRHLPRVGGRATGAMPMVILRALKDLGIYTWRWRVADCTRAARSELVEAM
jgi:cellulose synthase/poly-beta-1,6-N-acetylglucosamine synthase-like glycosyltransferase